MNEWIREAIKDLIMEIQSGRYTTPSRDDLTTAGKLHNILEEAEDK